MRRPIDLTGQRFGRLVVLERMENDSHNQARWLCKCDCGTLVAVRGNNLRSGHTSSCGCYRRNLHKEWNPNGISRTGESKTRLYSIWVSMKARCYRPQHVKYNNYGGRGIKICDEWLRDFMAFMDWALAHGYRDNLSIDRIDNDKGYSPDNCRWATAKEQARNKRPRK